MKEIQRLINNINNKFGSDDLAFEVDADNDTVTFYSDAYLCTWRASDAVARARCALGCKRHADAVGYLFGFVDID